MIFHTCARDIKGVDFERALNLLGPLTRYGKQSWHPDHDRAIDTPLAAYGSSEVWEEVENNNKLG